jgi:hypothetical protein
MQSECDKESKEICARKRDALDHDALSGVQFLYRHEQRLPAS